ncbi:FAD-dependent oxidoreductase [Halorarius halobius]|uniref:FAD-dependent oxidoreductase n=1 Tax=Halorarius halobius TaxID=2962671 RepID=UPI0020CFD279|nr:FAD-dependent oxidoreductase [Halorarius halobius]
MTSTSAVVVGGGATGTGIARELATRGVDVTLVERGRLADGASGAMHGLCHSGARYAVSDPESARACIAENRVLREIAPHCLEDTGGLFVSLPSDPDGYLGDLETACRDCDIPVERLDGAAAREREPALAPDVEAALAVPDAAVDPVRLVAATALAAEDAGADIRDRTAVTDVLVEGDRAVGVELDADERLRADCIVNAGGAWAGQVAALADVDVSMAPSRGAMAVVDRCVDAVVNRCRPKTSGDIVVPSGSAAILGTTDVAVDDPDDYPTEEWELDLLFEELSPVVPALAEADLDGAYWGVRPLYEPNADADGPTALSRGFSLLDHADRDGRPGLVSVVGGKLTTYRAMAEATADLVADRLGVDADSVTTERPLPGHDDPARLDAALDRFDLDGLTDRHA